MGIKKNIAKFSSLSPLRYPGGKSIMFPLLESIIKQNFLSPITYIEPYAGGAGAALALLYYKVVRKIHINDANIAIFSFWHSLLNHPQEFLHKFQKTNPTLEEWYKQKEIFETQRDQYHPSIELGFATFFLNRTNHSGILSAGPIGGKNQKQQEFAKYPIHARYNKSRLLEKLQWIIANKANIKTSNLDALALLRSIKQKPIAEQQNIFVYLDPPYFVHGKRLYMDFYTVKDHEDLSKFLKESNHFKWILSYDNVSEIQHLYSNNRQFAFSLTYSAATRREGKELLIYANNVNISNSQQSILMGE